MPYLLSLLQKSNSEEERLNPPPLVAKLRTEGQEIYINVLGGSNSRGGIALDPLVSNGRLADNVKVAFAQLREPRQVTHLPHSAVSLQFETLRRSDEVPQRRRENDQQRLEMNMLMVGSEEGFFVGRSGCVPWLCSVPGMRVVQQLTPHVRDVRRVPIALKVAR
jgi:hypothetical protein